MKSSSSYKMFVVSVIVLLFSNSIVSASDFDTLKPKKLANGMIFTEGPAWHPNGFVAFSDIRGNVIYKWDKQNGLDTLAYPSGNSNGIITTKENDFIVCRHSSRDISKMDTEGNISSFVSLYKGKKLNSPNDATLSKKGSIFFTDPSYGVKEKERELSFHGVYSIPYNQREPILLDSTLIKPNGILLSTKTNTLYVCESSSNIIYSYTVYNEYLVKDKRIFKQMDDSGGLDGLTLDKNGNLYVAFGISKIKILNTNAEEIGEITIPEKEKVRNLTFGGKRNNILFITAGESLYMVKVPF